MIKTLVIIAAALGLAAAATTNPPATLNWEDMFAPPYTTMPEICFNIQCVAKDLCYIPGGSNGAGFGMYTYNGKENANVNVVAEPNMTMMIMTSAIGGSKAKPRGAFGGFGLIGVSPGFQYLADNATEFLPSTTPPEFIVTTQSMRATDNGEHIVAVGSGPSGNQMLYSSNGGKDFSAIDIKIPLMNKTCTEPGYVAMIDEKTWYMTLGSFPSRKHHHHSNSLFVKKHGHHERVISEHPTGKTYVTRNVKTGKIGHHLRTREEMLALIAERRAAAPTSGAGNVGRIKCVGYTGQIAKTTDGGKTWTNQVESSEVDFAQIDCSSATNCVTVGYGVNAASGVPVTKVMRTTDGKNWSTVLHLEGGESSIASFQTIRFMDAKEVWMGGSLETQTGGSGLFYYSKDGGKSWNKYAQLQPNIMMIMDMSFADNVGFAVGMTMFKTSTVLRYKKQVNYGYFVQSHCPPQLGVDCNFLCQNITFPQGMCLTARGGSAMAFCHHDGIHQQIYETTSCIGSFNTTIQPIGKCLNATDGSFFKNYCDNFQSEPTGRVATVREEVKH